MAGTAGIPEKISNYSIYNSAANEERLLGIGAETTLPTFEHMSETISGAGIAGEYDSITPGHFGANDIEIPFRVVTDQLYGIAAGDFANITIRFAQQQYDPVMGTVVQKSLRINIRGFVKSINFGKVGVGTPGEASLTIGIVYYKVADDNNKTLFEVDKINFIYVVNGVDKLAAIRERI